jgi:hypothetical protein
MKTFKWERREKKKNKKKNRMRVSGKSVLLLEKIIAEKAEKAKKEIGNGK